MLRQALLLFAALAGAFGQTQAFINARIIDGSGKAPIENGVIIVQNGRITAVGDSKSLKPPAGAKTVDLTGKFVIPGLIAAHVHVSDVQGLKPPAYTEENTLRKLGLFARYGVTTVWSLGGEKQPAFAARDAQNTPTLDRARIYLSGDVVTGKTAEEARQMVAKVAAGKPDIIKIRVDDNLGASTKMPPEVYRAVIEEAHRRGLRVAAHIFYLEDAKDLLRAGADFIAHSVRDKEIDAEFIALMRKRNIPYCPTLTREVSTFVYESTPEFFSDPFFLREADREVIAQLKEPKRQEAMSASKSAQAYKAALEVAKRNLKKASDAGILIAMGTDSGASANRFQGYFEHLEMEMMAEAGLTPLEVLRSTTSDAARSMKNFTIGRIAKDTWADFIVLNQDPLQNIRNVRAIDKVFIAGNEVKR
jgi:imidazolonepropionase-like amidohydrolase